MAPGRIHASALARLLPDLGGAGATYRQLADALRLLIADGRVVVGSRLPSERELTLALGVSRTTVASAYAALRERGYLASRRGSGSVAQLPGPAAPPSPNALRPGDGAQGDWVDLTCAAPAAAPGLSAAFEAALEEVPGYLKASGYYPEGLPQLREAVAERFTERGLPTSADQVLITSGSLAALADVVRTVVDRGDRVLVESPSYPNALAGMRRHGARLAGVPVAYDGYDLEAYRAVIAQTSPLAAVLTPDFHNPTGLLMADAERAELAGLLTRAKTLPIADETLVETSMTDAPPPLPFAAHHRGAVTVGSASKSHWGGLRIGWIRAPRRLIGPLQAARLTLDLGAPVLEQLALTRLLHDGPTSMGNRVRPGRDVLAAAVRSSFPDWTFRTPEGGLFLWCRLPTERATALAAAAERERLLITPGSTFAAQGRGLEGWLRLPFTLPPERLVEAVRRLHVASGRLAEGRSRPRDVVVV